MRVTHEEALKCIIATLEQSKTHPADVAYALSVARDALALAPVPMTAPTPEINAMLLGAARRQVFTLDTTEYQFNHGHAPRGRGGWAFVFRVGDAVRVGDYTSDEIFWTAGSLTFAEARKVARAEALHRFPDAAAVTAGVCS